METVDALFDLLDKYRKFPAYQLERRADIFFALYLEEILKPDYNQDIRMIIPEFPVRKGAINEDMSNRSYKIDYVVFLKNSLKVLLVELKTEGASRNTPQDNYLKRSSEIGMEALVNGIITIYNHSVSKPKYKHLLKKLEKLGLVKHYLGSYTSIVEKDYNLEVLYIQPMKNKSSNKTERVITFKNVIERLSKNPDPTKMRFCKSLKRWTPKKGSTRS
jgi:hypothetical protein